MTETELAFLALGLILGAAAGAALIVVLGSRPARSDVRVTMARDAVPRRSVTLSDHAFVTQPAEPAPGGPGDRRAADRDAARPPVERRAPAAPREPVGIPIEPAATPAWLVEDRTPVPSRPSVAVGVAIRPEPDATLAALAGRPQAGPALQRILRGDHRAMVETIDALAGDDAQRRREWELLLSGLAEALTDVAVEDCCIDFPLGAPFWDTFTVEQCRAIVGALASMGMRYDGDAGWLDGRVPAYRDLSQALADVGIEPRRVRAWPNSQEIAELFVGARPAPEELVTAMAPDLDGDRVRALLGPRAETLPGLWLTWEQVRPVLLAPARRSAELA